MEPSRTQVRISLSDIISKNFITVQDGTYIIDAAKVMFKNNITSVGVKKGYKLVGIVTERDLVEYVAMGNKEKLIKDIMSSELISVDEDTDFLDAVRVMGKNAIRHVIVNRGGKPIGIASLKDILKIEPNVIFGYYGQQR